MIGTVIWLYFSVGIALLLHKRVSGYTVLMIISTSFLLTMIVSEGFFR